MSEKQAPQDNWKSIAELARKLAEKAAERAK